MTPTQHGLTPRAGALGASTATPTTATPALLVSASVRLPGRGPRP
jgi:hypothetical protein